MPSSFNIGVVSDTHGMLRPEVLDVLEGSELILHAGDIGDPEILEQLEEIAPVKAVRGNVDAEDWSRDLPLQLTVEVGGHNITVVHRLIDLRPEAENAVVVYGHSHKPVSERKNGVLYFNPGSAGPKRFRLPVTCGRLLVEASTVRSEIVRLLP